MVDPAMDDCLKAIVPDTIRGRVILQNARRMCAMRWRKSPNWVIASELFGLGSTYSYGLCRRLGIDPEARSALLKAGETQ